MFNCQNCGQTVPPRTPAVTVVVETRTRTYPAQAKVHPPRVTHPSESFPRPNLKARRELWQDDPGGVGRQIVREWRVCPACAERLKTS